VEQRTGGLLFQNSVFKWIALATGALLLIPLIAMQITNEVAWDSTDFIVMGSLIFGMSSLFVLVARKLPSKHRVYFGGAFFVVFLYIWAELAVGVLTNFGS
jgi:hypothetical protein